MEIQKGNEQFLRIDTVKKIFSEHDIHWDENSQKWQFDFSVPDVEVNYFLGAWKAWQAAKASVVEWISIQDKWPERGDPVLLIVNGVVQQVTYFRSYLNADDDWFEPVYFEGDCLPIHDVTHWQQLPELPKAQEPSND